VVIMEARLELKLSQKLIMTPQLQQAIKLLQLSRLELVQSISQELIENPVLEEVSSESAEEETPEGESSSPSDLPASSEQTAESATEPDRAAKRRPGNFAPKGRDSRLAQAGGSHRTEVGRHQGHPGESQDCG